MRELIVAGAIGVFGTLIGSLGTQTLSWWTNRNSASREARRETYLELLTMLKAALRVQQPATYGYDPEVAIPDVISDDRIDDFNARIEIDASPQLRDLTRQAFRLAGQFNASLAMKAPADLDEHGFYRYRFDLVRNVDDEAARLHMRMSLGKIHDELATVVDQLAARMRRELHGAGS
jgi:hypothetical protein